MTEPRNHGRLNVAIVGAGFSGAALAAQLLNNSAGPLSVALIERGASRARGVAYSTQESRHLLNVPAENMSALADDPQHFLTWARSNFDSGVQPADYLPRRLYGQYLESVLDESANRNPGTLVWKQQSAISLRKLDRGAAVVLENDEEIVADFIVFALGNFPSASPLPGKVDEYRRYQNNPWSQEALVNAPENGSILLIGSGLTSVDTMLSLRAGGFRGTIHMISRHGLLPQAHIHPSEGPVALPKDLLSGTFVPTARELLRIMREQVELGAVMGRDWRCLIDAFRPITQPIWKVMPITERTRFIRHLRAFWEVHRHRVAPDIGKALDHQLSSGKLRVHAGRITGYQETPHSAVVSYRERKSGRRRQISANLVVNCTGPASDVRKASNPLLSDCIRQGFVRPDPLFLGLESADEGVAIEANGSASDFLYVIGSLRKGTLWESIAVPELRVQAAELASVLGHKSQTERRVNASVSELATYA